MIGTPFVARLLDCIGFFCVHVALLFFCSRGAKIASGHRQYVKLLCDVEYYFFDFFLLIFRLSLL